MSQIKIVCVGLFFSLSIVALILVVSPVRAHAHGDEEHAESTSVSEEQIEHLETLLQLLKELVVLVRASEYRPSSMSVTTTPVVVDDHADAEMEMHHTEHSTATTTEVALVAKLVIEVEAHNGKTHVHVRYVDKPEDMFFVEAPLTDEAGIVSGVATRTGLGADEIKAAIKYMQ